MAAVSEQEEFEFRRRAEAEQRPPSPAKQERSLLGALGEGLWNLPGQAVQAWHGATVDLPSALMDPKKRQAMADAIGQSAQGAADTAKGYLQQARELSPPEFRGSMAPMDKAPAEAMERAVIDKLGVNITPAKLAAALNKGDLGQPNLNAYRTGKDMIAEDPLGVALLAAGPTAKALRVPAMAAAGVAGKVKPVAMARALMDAGATPAAEKLSEAARAKVLALRRSAEDAEALAASRKAADKPLRADMEKAAEDQAAKGIGVSDLPEARALAAEMKAKLNPSGAVATTPTAGQAAAYKKVLEALTPAEGAPKPSLEQISNLRRELAEAAYGGADPAGFAAIGKIERGDLVKRLHEIEDVYTGGKSGPVRENWAAAKVAEEEAESMAKLRNKLTAEAARLEELTPFEAAKSAKSIVKSLADKGMLSDPEYRDFLQLANAATDAKGKAAFRKRLALAGASAAGLSAGAGLVGEAVGGPK